MVYYFRVLQIEKQNRHFNFTDFRGNVSNVNISPLILKVKQYFENYDINNLEVLNLKALSVPPWLIPKIDVCFEMCEKPKSNSSAEELKQLFLQHKHESRISMYTDGSKCENGTGAGVVVVRKSEDNYIYDPYRLKLNKIASVFSAELIAIEAAINSLKKNKNASCCIYSDSKSALQAILKYDSKNPIVQNIHVLLLNIYKNNTTIKFCWVPAHCGIKGNEMADKTAKEATKFSKNCNNSILLSDIKSFLKEKVSEKWKQSWNTKTNNKLFNVDSSIGKKVFSCFNTRIEEIKFTRLRLGHTKLTHKFRLLAEPQPLCNLCNCYLSVKHFLIECPKYDTERTRFLGPNVLNLSDILERENFMKINKILDFIKHSKQFSEI